MEAKNRTAQQEKELQQEKMQLHALALELDKARKDVERLNTKVAEQNKNFEGSQRAKTQMQQKYE